MNNQEAIRTAELIRELEAKKQRLQDWIDGLKDEMKQYLAEQGENSMLLGDNKVSYVEFTTHRFDCKAFREEHGDLYKQYEISSTVKRFSIN